MTITIITAGGVTNNGPYSTLAAYATDLNAASLSGNHVAEVSGTISDTAKVTLGGYTANGFSVTLRAASGEGVNDGGRLWWLTSGRAILTNSLTGDFCYVFAGANMTVQGLQIRASNALASAVLQIGNSTTVVEKSIIMQDSSSAYVVQWADAGGILRTSLVISQGDGVRATGAAGTVRRSTIVRSSSGAGTGLRSDYGGLLVQGCAIYNFNTISNGNAASGSTHNAINGTTWGGTGYDTSGQTGLVSGDFVNTGSGTEDYAAASGSTRLVNTGTSITGVSTDVFGVAVPTGGTEDIGATEFSSGGGTTSANLINSNLLAGRLLRGLKG